MDDLKKMQDLGLKYCLESYFFDNNIQTVRAKVVENRQEIEKEKRLRKAEHQESRDGERERQVAELIGVQFCVDKPALDGQD